MVVLHVFSHFQLIHMDFPVAASNGLVVVLVAITGLLKKKI